MVKVVFLKREPGGGGGGHVESTTYEPARQCSCGGGAIGARSLACHRPALVQFKWQTLIAADFADAWQRL